MFQVFEPVAIYEQFVFFFFGELETLQTADSKNALPDIVSSCPD